MNLRTFFLTAWTWEGWLWPAVLLAALGYYFLKRRVGGTTHVGFFLFGLAIVFVALCSPLNVLAEGYLFSAHMVQHLLLLLIAPAVFLLSLPKKTKTPAWFRRRGWSGLGWISGVGAMWLWHVPSLCDAASLSGPLRAIQAFSLLLMGTFFWWPILAPSIADRVAPWKGVVYLFTACLACSALGILITLTPLDVCPVFRQPVDRFGIMSTVRETWGLTAARDREIGGLLMWVPMCAVYGAAILMEVNRWYAKEKGINSEGLA